MKKIKTKSDDRRMGQLNQRFHDLITELLDDPSPVKIHLFKNRDILRVFLRALKADLLWLAREKNRLTVLVNTSTLSPAIAAKKFTLPATVTDIKALRGKASAAESAYNTGLDAYGLLFQQVFKITYKQIEVNLHTALNDYLVQHPDHPDAADAAEFVAVISKEEHHLIELYPVAEKVREAARTITNTKKPHEPESDTALQDTLAAMRNRILSKLEDERDPQEITHLKL